MDTQAYFDRPMVRRLIDIFGDPKPPPKVTEEQFDWCQRELEALAKKPWDEVGNEDFWYYLLDLAYVPLQQDLFDYLFPAFLILWREGQLDRTGGPEAECDFYFAIYMGNVLEKMMGEDRRAAVLQWIVDAYMDGVDAWSGKLSTMHIPNGPNNLHGPLWSFHALGQSVPVCPSIWDRLSRIETAGRAQWWLVLVTGIAFPPNQLSYVPAWTPDGGGGGIYVLESAAAIYGNGYLPANLEFISRHCTAEILVDRLQMSIASLASSYETEWANAVLSHMRSKPEQFAKRLGIFLDYLGKPDLGGVASPLDKW